MEDFAIRVELLNRFRTKKEQETIIKKLKLGEIDVIVGTHRILSKDVEFKDLGLLIIDEEHRLGVKDKEKIKKLKGKYRCFNNDCNSNSKNVTYVYCWNKRYVCNI